MPEDIRLDDIESAEQLDQIIWKAEGKIKSIHINSALLRLIEDYRLKLMVEKRRNISFSDLINDILYDKIKQYVIEHTSPIEKAVKKYEGGPAPEITIQKDSVNVPCFHCDEVAKSFVMHVSGRWIRGVCERHKENYSGIDKWISQIKPDKCSLCDQQPVGFIMGEDRNILPVCEQHLDENLKSGRYRMVKVVEET
jgi:hypothetical protein